MEAMILNHPVRFAQSAIIDSVRQAVIALLAMGRPTLACVAEEMDTSIRTLQRQLAASGLSYSEVLNEVLYHSACQLLNDPAIKICDIAKALGYGDAASFTRTFIRWHGITPSDYRRNRKQQLTPISPRGAKHENNLVLNGKHVTAATVK
jgi:AraC-like DNA-binding protein